MCEKIFKDITIIFVFKNCVCSDFRDNVTELAKGSDCAEHQPTLFGFGFSEESL